MLQQLLLLLYKQTMYCNFEANSTSLHAPG
jgi:hypothetical protein